MIGLRLNNYEVKALIGEGGMGSVYVAEHPVIGRQVAIKVLKPMFATAADVVGRFFNEAKAANAIGHPGIVDVIDVGNLPDGLPYLMMELLKGESLAARIERMGRLPIDETIELGKQAASALGAAHAVGIVHRDLKPANLFLSPDRESFGRFRLKVLDFGIAKLTGSLHGDQVKTGTGAVLGTPAYMSPEQSLGRSDGIDHRTDIYALGLILHHALAGAPPFLAEGFGEMVMLHMTAPPPALRTKNAGVSAALEALVLRALAKKPEDRFQSMAELGRALEQVQRGQPAGAGEPGWAPDLGQAPTTALDVALPRTVRLAARSEPPAEPWRPPSRSLSTTLSKSAVEVEPETGPLGASRSRRPWILVGGGALAALTVAAVILVGSGSSRSPRAGGATEAAAEAPPMPRRLPQWTEPPSAPMAPVQSLDERGSSPGTGPRDLDLVRDEVGAVKVDTPPPPPPVPERKRATRSRAVSSRSPASTQAASEVGGGAANRTPAATPPAPAPVQPASAPDAGARKKMKMW